MSLSAERCWCATMQRKLNMLHPSPPRPAPGRCHHAATTQAGGRSLQHALHDSHQRETAWLVQGRHGFFHCSEEKKKKKLISGTAVRGKDGNNHTQIDKK